MQQKKSEGGKRDVRDASRCRVGIVVSGYYADINNRMLEGARETLRAWQVADKNVTVVPVPGSFEIPYGCLSLLKRGNVDAIITLGCLVKGETKHDEVIANAVAGSLMRLMEQYGTPITFGVLTVNTLEQAEARSTGSNNKGIEAAEAALTLALL
jgi:6,7-dimethyl-8-ribityllumazine synthase